MLSGLLKCKCSSSNMLKRTSKDKTYYYCTNYFKKKCTSHSIEKSKLENILLEDLKIDELTRKYLYAKVNVIYINEDKSINIDYK